MADGRRNTRATGDEGEAIAMRHLKEAGFTIVAMNYRFGNKGEIDIVAQDGDTLVFCEVKMRTNDRYGDPEYAITPRKQTQIRKVAEAYLVEHGIVDRECRFDVVAITHYPGQPMQIRHLRNAF